MNVLVVSPSPVDQFEKQGNLSAFVGLHNPNGMFDEVHVIQPTTTEGGVVEVSDGLLVHRTRWPQPDGTLGALVKAVGLLIVLCRGVWIAKRERVDLIRGQGMVPGGLFGLLLKWATGVPNVTSIHTDFDKVKRVKGRAEVLGSPFLTRLVERTIVRRSSAVFVLTPYLREMMLRRGVDESNVYVVPNHIDTDEFARLATEDRAAKRDELGLDDGFDLLFVGRLVDAKDPTTLLEGFRAAKSECPELQLVVVGDGPHRDAMERFVARHGFEDDVVFTGFVPREEVAAIMGATDALVQPSLFEGFGFVYIEAQAAGLPIVTTDLPHTKSIVNAENAFMFPPGDAEALAGRLVAVVTDDERRETMIERGAETVERFDTDRQHDRHEAALRDVARQ